MNTVYQGLYNRAKEISDETDRYNFYVNYSIEYLCERIEHMIINVGNIDEAKEKIRIIEGTLDRIEGDK